MSQEDLGFHTRAEPKLEPGQTSNKELKFKQICVGQFSGGSGMSFAVIGLSEEGEVWQFRTGRWQRLDEIERSRSQARAAAKSNEEPPW